MTMKKKDKKRKNQAEKIKLTTRQILLYLVDGLVSISEPFDRHGMYKKYIEDYFGWRNFDRKKFSNDLKRLEREGMVETYFEKNKNLVKLSKKGKHKVGLILAEEYKFIYPKSWDGKWRIIIFDIPNAKNRNRDIFRAKLKEIGCIQLQESVFVLPFDCKEIVDYFKNLFEIQKCVQYIVAEKIEMELDLVSVFCDKGLLSTSMI